MYNSQTRASSFQGPHHIGIDPSGYPMPSPLRHLASDIPPHSQRAPASPGSQAIQPINTNGDARRPGRPSNKPENYTWRPNFPGHPDDGRTISINMLNGSFSSYYGGGYTPAGVAYDDPRSWDENHRRIRSHHAVVPDDVLRRDSALSRNPIVLIPQERVSPPGAVYGTQSDRDSGAGELPGRTVSTPLVSIHQAEVHVPDAGVSMPPQTYAHNTNLRPQVPYAFHVPTPLSQQEVPHDLDSKGVGSTRLIPDAPLTESPLPMLHHEMLASGVSPPGPSTLRHRLHDILETNESRENNDNDDHATSRPERVHAPSLDRPRPRRSEANVYPDNRNEEVPQGSFVLPTDSSGSVLPQHSHDPRDPHTHYRDPNASNRSRGPGLSTRYNQDAASNRHGTRVPIYGDTPNAPILPGYDLCPMPLPGHKPRGYQPSNRRSPHPQHFATSTPSKARGRFNLANWLRKVCD